MARISRHLKHIAKHYSLPVVALSQLTRNPANLKRRPILSDLKESGAIEQDSDIVMFLHASEPEPSIGGIVPPRDYVGILAKNRNGPICDIPLAYHPRWTRFFTIHQTKGTP